MVKNLEIVLGESKQKQNEMNIYNEILLNTNLHDLNIQSPGYCVNNSPFPTANGACEKYTRQ